MDMIRPMKQNDFRSRSFTDLHSHILPAVDDGAIDMEMAAEMLRLQKYKGVDRLALTPHYYALREPLENFLDRRQQAYDVLLSCWDGATMPQIKLGAEVRCTPKLTEMELHSLTIGGSNYLLLELPDQGVAPFLDQVIDSILSQNIIPVIAHVERCVWLRNQPEQLYKLVQMGTLAQITISSLMGRRDGFAKVCLKKGLAHIISSDAHRPGDCIDFLSSGISSENVFWTESFSRAIWDNTPLPAFSVATVNKGLFGYR